MAAVPLLIDLMKLTLRHPNVVEINLPLDKIESC